MGDREEEPEGVILFSCETRNQLSDSGHLLCVKLSVFTQG